MGNGLALVEVMDHLSMGQNPSLIASQLKVLRLDEQRWFVLEDLLILSEGFQIL